MASESSTNRVDLSLVESEVEENMAKNENDNDNDSSDYDSMFGSGDEGNGGGKGGGDGDDGGDDVGSQGSNDSDDMFGSSSVEDDNDDHNGNDQSKQIDHGQNVIAEIRTTSVPDAVTTLAPEPQNNNRGDNNDDDGDGDDDFGDMFGEDDDENIESNLVNGSASASSHITTESAIATATITSPIVATGSQSRKLTSSSAMAIPRKRKASGMAAASSPLTQSTIPRSASMSKSTITSTSVNDMRSNIIRKGQSNLGVHLKRRPDQYKSFQMSDFWSSLRQWNFLADLNASCTQISRRAASSNDNNAKEDGKSQSTQPLPDEFHCHEHYLASWAPLLIRETKAQVLSDISSKFSSQSDGQSGIQLGKMTVPVKVMTKNGNSAASMMGDELKLEISSRSNATPNYSKGGGQSRIQDAATAATIRNEFLANDLVFIVCDPSVVNQAYKGMLKIPEKASSYSVTSLLSLASPFVDKRLGVIGVVTQWSKGLGSNGTLVVQVSRRLWKTTSIGSDHDLYMLRLGSNVTAIREFRALCTMKEMALSKYLLSPKLDIHPSPNSNGNPLSEFGGSNVLGIGFRIWVKSKFNSSQQASISAAAREYGDGGFTLIKGPPGTGKTTTLVALLNALHLRQYQKYYSEIERITLMAKTSSQIETLAAISAAAKVKPRILVCAPSNAAVDNVCQKIMTDKFLDGNGCKYSPSMIRVGFAPSSAVSSLTLKAKLDKTVSQGSNPSKLETAIVTTRAELKRFQNEIRNLQLRVRLIAKGSIHPISRDWEIRIDEENFVKNQRVLYVNHKMKKVQLKSPERLAPGEEEYPIDEMPHYRGNMQNLVKYIERHNDMSARLKEYVLLQNAAANLSKSKRQREITSELNDDLEMNILESTHIVLTTLGSSGGNVLSSHQFSVIVIDEAAQCSEPSMLPALHRGSSHCVLVGDPAQLPATIFEVSGRETKYDRSLFQRLEEAGHHVYMLNTQYRMHPKISSFPRRIFYKGSLVDGPNVSKVDYGGDLSILVKSRFQYFQPFTIFDLDSEEERDGTNLSNMTEALFALQLFESLDQESNGLAKKSRVAIVTPYQQQVFLLKRIFEGKYGLSYTRFVDISTIDSFQGKEASIVILSCVRASTPLAQGAKGGGGIGFLSDVQRMNVALTRAKHFLFVIARCRTILVNPYWRDLVTHARSQQAILPVVPQKIGGVANNPKMRGGGMRAPNIQFPDLKNLRPSFQTHSHAIQGMDPRLQWNH